MDNGIDIDIDIDNNDENNTTDNCVICLEPLDNGSEKYSLECAHTFHKECTMSWLKTKPTCPLCRTIINPEPRYLRDNILTQDQAENLRYLKSLLIDAAKHIEETYNQQNYSQIIETILNSEISQPMINDMYLEVINNNGNVREAATKKFVGAIAMLFIAPLAYKYLQNIFHE